MATSSMDRRPPPPSGDSRARLRWRMLRAAILGGGDDGNDDVGRASIHAFPGFRLLERRVVSPARRASECGPMGADCGGGGGGGDDESGGEYDVVEYSIPVHGLPTEGAGIAKAGNEASPPPSASEVDPPPPLILKVRTRERPSSTPFCGPRILGGKVDLKALTSERHHGVDNTSDACVWDAECTLAHCLTRRRRRRRGGRCDSDGTDAINLNGVLSLAVPSPHGGKRLRVVELGAGMAGISGLALYSLSCSRRVLDDGAATMPGMDVVLTDGHPSAVENNRACVALTAGLLERDDDDDLDDENHPAGRRSVRACRLLWRADAGGAAECAELTDRGRDPFRLCLVSDCLHFTDFHPALLATIGRLLDRRGGVCVLCQPERGTSVRRFLDLVECVNSGHGDGISPLFEVTRLPEDYDERVTDLHRTFTAERSSLYYEPSKHYPMLIRLRKLREYDESVDTANSRRHAGVR